LQTSISDNKDIADGKLKVANSTNMDLKNEKEEDRWTQLRGYER